MKVKKLILITGEEYENIKLSPVTTDIPKEFDSMLEFRLGNKRILLNVAMVVTAEI